METKLSEKALNAIGMIRDEYGDDIANELMATKISKPRINCDVVNEYHIKLLKRTYWQYEYSEYGAVGLSPKRPYGNSDVLGDIRELTGLPNSNTTLDNLHRGLGGVLQLWGNRGCPDLKSLIGEPIKYDKVKR